MVATSSGGSDESPETDRIEIEKCGRQSETSEVDEKLRWLMHRFVRIETYEINATTYQCIARKIQIPKRFQMLNNRIYFSST